MDINKVFENNQNWIASKLEIDPHYFEDLSKGQNPDILYIGCSDSRVTAEDLMGVQPGEVFVHRNIANMVISIDLNVMSVLNYAVNNLGVNHVVVCGHYFCGGVKAAMNAADLGILNPWLRNIRDVYRIHKRELNAIDDENEKYNRLVELNVQEQCVNLIKTAAVQKAIKEKYPNIKIVASSGTGPDGDRFELLNTELRKMNTDLIDEHYDRSPEWFFSSVRRYDNYPRTGSKVFAGEYASHVDKTNGAQRNTWLAAISEAAFMTGLERNADVVTMASYAPLFSHIDGWQWAPDMIWVDNLRSYGSPTYYVQKLFSLNKGSKVVPLTLNNDVVAGQDSLYASSVIDAATNELVIKIVNASNKEQATVFSVEGVKKLAAQGNLTVLQGSNLTVVNSFDQPAQVAPKESTIAIKNKKFDYTATPYSFSVLRIKMQ